MNCVEEFYTGKDLSLLEKLTLVIPTYNRNFYLSRCLWYHAHFPFAEIIVADSSPEEKKVVNRETVEKIREKFGANITYLEYEPETEKYGGDIYRKWGDAVQHVETEYSQICTDKEFLIPTTLCECIWFLDKNPDYNVVEGADYQIKYINSNYAFIPWQSSTSAILSDPLSRLLYFTTCEKGGSGTLFGIQRSENHKLIYQNLAKYNINDVRFGETALELQPVLIGKSKRFSDLTANCRDLTNIERKRGIFGNTNMSESSYARYLKPFEYPSYIYNQGVKGLEQCCINLIILNSNETEEVIEGTLNQIIPIIMKGRYETPDTLLRTSPILYKMWIILPISIKDLIRNKIGMNKNPIVNLTPEMNIILAIIKKSQKNHVDDKSVIDIL